MVVGGAPEQNETHARDVSLGIIKYIVLLHLIDPMGSSSKIIAINIFLVALSFRDEIEKSTNL